jgi:hypothetical protein
MAQNHTLLLLCASLAGATYVNAQGFDTEVFDALHSYKQNPAALHRLRTTVAHHADAFRELIVRDPAAALATAIPADVRQEFPTEVRDMIEQQVTLGGQMEVTIEDGLGYSRINYRLISDGRRIALHFADRPSRDLQSGTQVQVQGVRAGDVMVLRSSGMAMAASGASPLVLPNSFGAQKTLVILVNFRDLTTQPYSPSTAYSVTFTSASNFYLNNSFQQTWLTGDVTGWYTIPVSSTTCDTNSIQNYGLQAAQNAGFVPSNYNHIVYAFPQTSACSFWGLSNIGGNPSNSWINGSYQLMVVAHELGHGFGLYHSHSLSCGSAVYATSGCTMTEYGDTFDAMGSSYPDDFNAAQKERLGWLNYGSQPPITTVSASGVYSLGPYETNDAQAKALKIAGPNATYYYVEARQAVGDDASSLSGNNNVLTGVILHNDSPNDPNSSYLLSAAPGGSFTSPALGAGKSYTDSTMGFTITPLSVGSNGASVQVTYGSTTCNHANPSLTVTGPSGSVAPGTTANFTVVVANKDSGACTSSTFTMSDSVPPGWTGVYNTSTITLSPGSSGPVILWVTAPSGTASGAYTVSANTTNTSAAGYSASGSATDTIYTPSVCSHANPSLTVTGPSGSVAPGVTAAFTVTVANNDTAACTASSFALSSVVPAGWTGVYNASTITLSPGTSMGVTLSVTAPFGTANGTYTVSAGANNTSFAGYTSTASAPVTIGATAPLTLSISTNQQAYTGPQKATINVASSSNSALASGVAVTVNLVKADGSGIVLSGTTGTNGIATVTYQVKKNDPQGTWQATAHSGTASASTTFLVH